MNGDIVKIMHVLPLAASASLFLAMMLLCVFGQEGRVRAQNGYRKAVMRIADRGRELAWYQRTELWLERNGVKYHLGIKVAPMTYLAFRIGLAAALFVVFWMLAPAYGVLAGGIGFFLPTVLVLYMNRKDNLRMLPELKLMYHSLEIQTRAGVYVTDTLAELYGSVWERRLKQALLELAGDLVMRADLGEALERFQKKFDNRYIDSLCMIILQATESGQAVDLLGDLSEQIKDMEAAVLGQKKEALDRSVTFYQLGILVAVMGLVLYACVTQMFTAATSF